jgi:hypothetical protein
MSTTKQTPEEWMKLLAPLLLHLKGGGKVAIKGRIEPFRLRTFLEVSVHDLLDNPDQYEIHREPREIYKIQDPRINWASEVYTEAEAKRVREHYGLQKPHGEQLNITRYVEDLTYKPS